MPPPFWWMFVRWCLFRFDAERVHNLALFLLACWSQSGTARLSSDDVARNPYWKRNLFGIEFPNPVGLAAGFDKNAVAIPAWAALGFGFVEVGTVTALSQSGNPRPRLFRLPRDQALFNHLGFNNHGAHIVAARIARARNSGRVNIPIGVNIGKSAVTPLDQAPVDYVAAFSAIADVADYVVINVSSPNTPGLRDLQQEERFVRLLDAVCAANQKRHVPRPLLVKLSPDLSWGAALACAQVAMVHGLAGLVVANTTTVRDGMVGDVSPQPGGISGRPLFMRSTALLRELHAAFGEKLAFIGVGGITNAATAQEKFAAGADLIQTYTGFVYGGPGFPRTILRELVEAEGAR